MLPNPLTIYAIGCIAVPWLICRSLQRPENSTRAIFGNRNDRTSANGLGASFGPGFRPSDQAAARLGSSSINPSRGGTVRAFNEGD